MSRQIYAALVALSAAGAPGLAVAADVAGAKGQNFDRLVFETSSNDETKLTARGMAILRLADSAATITLTDNGAAQFGPETISQERWTRTIAIKGAGRHEVVLLCQGVKAAPVYCGLSLDDDRARVVE